MATAVVRHDIEALMREPIGDAEDRHSVIGDTVQAHKRAARRADGREAPALQAHARAGELDVFERATQGVIDWASTWMKEGVSGPGGKLAGNESRSGERDEDERDDGGADTQVRPYMLAHSTLLVRAGATVASGSGVKSSPGLMKRSFSNRYCLS